MATLHFALSVLLAPQVSGGCFRLFYKVLGLPGPPREGSQDGPSWGRSWGSFRGRFGVDFGPHLRVHFGVIFETDVCTSNTKIQYYCKLCFVNA